jgi:hypothetical protein
LVSDPIQSNGVHAPKRKDGLGIVKLDLCQPILGGWSEFVGWYRVAIVAFSSATGSVKDFSPCHRFERLYMV